MFGTPKVKGVVGLLNSLGPLMIGKWKVWSAFWWSSKQKGCIRMWKIGWYGQPWVGTFRLNLSILFWSQVTLLFQRNIIWRSCAPPKVTFFAWEVTWGKALILDQVQRRGYSLANRCFFCHSEEEVDHILLYYVQRRDFFGNFCFLSLRWLWFSPIRLRRHSLGGMISLWIKPAKSLERWLLYVSFGQCGRKKTC